MICPKCQTSNSEAAACCSKCGFALLNLDDMETMTLAVTPSVRVEEIDADRPLLPGTQLGSRYRIEALIGRGGMGLVYKAYDAELDRMVALKAIRPELISQPEVMQRFKRELSLASKISHKNILRIHDLVEVGGMRFISMAFIDGEDLHSLLKDKQPLPTDKIINITRQLCAALDAAHSEEIIHRDLKPQNILIDKDGNVVISDFGLAKSLDSAAAKMTHTGEVLGTPRYMSPEQVKGRNADQRSDLYALGLIMYEMATGEVPFASDTLYQSMFLRTKERPRNPKLLNPDLSDFLARIILRCLETDPEHRYQSAREILQDLETEQAPPRSMRIAIPAPPGRRWIGFTVLMILMIAGSLLLPGVRKLFFASRVHSSRVLGKEALDFRRTYVAVLPFKVLGDQATLGYLADGIGEALCARLYQLKQVYIPSFAEAEKAAAKGERSQIARELGVKLLVGGTIAKPGEKIAVIVNLEDATSGQMLWSKEFSGLAQDLLTLQDKIYGELLTALQLNPNSEERARIATHLTGNIAAYDLYLRGRNAIRGQQNIDNIKLAILHFERALAQDSGFALAYVGLSDADLVMYRMTKDIVWVQRALSAGEQAQRLNDQIPEVYFALGSVYNATGKTAESIAVLNRALQLAPNSDEGYRRLGAAYVRAGLQDEGIRAYQKAIEINPYYWLNYSVLGGAYFKIGELDQALKAYHKIIELEPKNVFGPLNVGAVLFSQGKYEECIPMFRKALEIQPSWETYSNLGTAYFYLKRMEEAVEALEKAVALNPNQEVAVGNLADAYRWSGQTEKAAAAYDRAIELALKELEVNPRNSGAMASLALYYAKKGNAPRAADFIRRARAVDANNVEYIYNEAIVRTLAGRTQEAIQSLRLTFEKGYAVSDALRNPELDKLKDLPEFKNLISEFGKEDSRYIGLDKVKR